MTHVHAGGPFWALVVAWWGMMAVMMLPVTWPWLRALALLSPAAAGERRRLASPASVAFAGGYLLVWLGFSVAAAALQRVIAPLAPGVALEGSVLAAAGLYQLTPLKAACLERCRSPLSVLLSRWPPSGRSALRLGLEHGLFCLGCCWALMLVGLGAGAVAWAWMAALALLVAAEKLTAAGPLVARWAGVALLALAGAAWLR
jgi:predicted metal-binding membrane protein